MNNNDFSRISNGHLYMQNDGPMFGCNNSHTKTVYQCQSKF